MPPNPVFHAVFQSLGRAFGRIVEPPPMPPEAYLPGVIGRTPAARALMELAWRGMFLETLALGVILGMVLFLVIMFAVFVRGQIQGILQGAIAHATRDQQ